jgi:hypothetical protein
MKGIVKKKEYNLYLLAFLIGIVSFLFVPLETNDKAVYYSYYDNFKSLDFQGFQAFLTFNPDFIFYGLIYLFAILGIKIEFLFLLLTTLTVSIYFWFFLKFKFNELVSGPLFFLMVMGVLFSLALDTLLSGVRFNLAISFTLVSFHKIFFQKKNIQGYFFILLSVLTHFSFAVFLPFVVLLKVLSEKTIFFKIIFLFSFIFLFIPKNVLISSIPFLDTIEVLESKGNAYLDAEEDFLTNNLKNGNTNNLIVYFLSILWVYFSYVYLYLTFKNKSIIRNFVLIIFSISNFFYQFPTIYVRYLLVLKIFILINVYLDVKNKHLSNRMLFALVFLFALPFFLQIYILGQQFIKGIFSLDSLSLITIFLKESLKSNDFLEL